jgi:hypothetical protein
MMTDEKTVLVARSKLPKCMDSERDDLVPVGNSEPRESRNHLTAWLADTIEVMGVASVVPEIPSTPRKSDSNAERAGTTATDASSRRRPILPAPISRS